VKLVVAEAESDALREMLARDPDQLTSVIVEVEVVRAVRRGAPDLVPLAQRVVSQVTVVEVSEAIRTRASLLDPVGLRSLDALHLATALELGDDLDAVVTYDSRMAEAAASLDLQVAAPVAPRALD
jgi:predicted nucleic acid-binding protein